MKTIEEREQDLIDKGWYKFNGLYTRNSNPYKNPMLYFTLEEAEESNKLYDGSGYSC